MIAMVGVAFYIHVIFYSYPNIGVIYPNGLDKHGMVSDGRPCDQYGKIVLDMIFAHMAQQGIKRPPDIWGRAEWKCIREERKPDG
jgi:hypothetical protein